jgi:hypothetical protein
MTTTILQQVPESPDPSRSYLFYLHGLIVEEAGIRPKSEEHGYYEYELILQALAAEGFLVLSEARERGTRVRPYAEKIAGQVRQLLAGGVPRSSITVVGASKGGIIAAYVASLLREQAVNSVFLSGLFEKCLQDEELRLWGNVLSIHDRSDTLSITPTLFFQRSEGQGRFREIVLELGLGHGLIYQPRREWIDPMLAWLREA